MNIRIFFAIVSFCLLCVFLADARILEAKGVRTWTDKSGKFTFEASYVGSDGKQVRIKDTTGKILTIALDKLSQADNDYVKGLSEENPFAAAEREAESVRNGGTTSSGTGSRQTTRPVSVQGAKVLRIDLNEGAEIGDFGPKEWLCEIDPAPIQRFATKPRKLTFRLNTVPSDVSREETPFYFTPNDGKIVHTAVMLSSSNDADGKKKVTRMFFGETETGKVYSVDCPEKLYPYGFSPDGKKLLFREGDWDSFASFGKKEQLHVFSFNEGTISPLYSFVPFGQLTSRGSSSRDKNLEWAAWVDDDHIMVLSEDYKLVLIDMKSAKAVWQMKISSSAKKVALSPGGKYCIIPTSDGKINLFVETLTGETLGNIQGLSSFRDVKIEFSPDGKKFVACERDQVIVWDARTGKIRDSILAKRVYSFSDITWVNNNFVLINNTLIDTVNGVPIWEYQIRDKENIKGFGGCFWCMSTGNREAMVLNFASLPHPAAQIIRPDDPNAFVMSPGSSVTLVLDNSITKYRDEIGKLVTKKLIDNGMKIDNAAGIAIMLKQVKEPEEKITYYETDRFMPIIMHEPKTGGTVVTFRPETYRIQIIKGGKVMWEDSQTTKPPMSFRIDKEKTSYQKHVDDEMAKSNYKDWIENVYLPKKVIDPEKVGYSRISEMGIEDLDRRELDEMRKRLGL